MNKIKVEIMNEQNIFKPDIDRLKRITRYVLRQEGCQETQVCIVLTDDTKIKDLNKRYRKVNKPTDVLAFCQQDSKAKALKSNLLGDVVISVETAKRQAREYKQTLSKEIYFYLVHGILHLLNYKDKNPKDYQVIKRKQGELLNQICKEEH